MDRFESMSVFVEIVSTGSLTTAAERLGLSPSMVGKHLNALEQCETTCIGVVAGKKGLRHR